MKLVVSDEFVIVDISQGIRNVTWGETSSIYSSGNRGKYHLTVTYKNSNSIFYYLHESEVRSMFEKVRDAMGKRNRKEVE